MLGPETEPRVTCEGLVVYDDIDLGVVEERVFVEIGGPDGQPAVVHDRDLRVHVDRIAQLARACIDGAGEEPRIVVVGLNERGDLAT